MRHNSHISLNLSQYRTDQSPSNNYQYKSKLVADLMNSDSDDDYSPNKNFEYDYTEYLQGETKKCKENTNPVYKSVMQYTNISKNKAPPLANRKNYQKQNCSVQGNRNKEQIKYQCYKLSGNQLIEHNEQKYSTQNIQDASMIPVENQQSKYESNQQHIIPLFNNNNKKMEQKTRNHNESRTLTRQLYRQKNREPLKKQYSSRDEQSTTIIQQQQKQLKSLKRQINLLQQQIELKDSYYEQLNKNYTQKLQQYKQLEQNLHEFTKQKQKLSDRILVLEANLKDKDQLIKQYSRKSNIDTQQIYEEISIYINKIVQQSKNRLIKHKMSPIVQDIIEQFMTELININTISVSRSKSKTKTNMFDSVSYQDKNAYSTNQTNLNKRNLHKTPQRQSKIQKTQQMRDLQKSLQKLRDMEKDHTPHKSKTKYSIVTKYNTSMVNYNLNASSIGVQNSYMTTTPIIKQQADSLDRSSIMLIDRSINKSKSRRKKIFQRTPN